MLDLKGLRMLREVQRRGTLAAVAAAMSYSPATISQQLSQLEAQAGTKLLEPVGRGVRLTAEAEILVGHTDVILEVLERAEAQLAAASEDVSGTLHLAIFQSAALKLLPPVLEALGRQHARLRLQVTHLEPEEALEALTTRAADVAITQEYPAEPLARSLHIKHHELFKDPIRLVAAGGQQANSLSEFARQRWVMEPAGSPMHRWGFAHCRAAGFEPDVQFYSYDLVLHRRLIEAQQAVGFLPDLALVSDTSAIRAIPLEAHDAFRSVFLSTRSGTDQHPRILAFKAAVIKASASFQPHLFGEDS